jgi:predicted alpha-1,2-mannosidase
MKMKSGMLSLLLVSILFTTASLAVPENLAVEALLSGSGKNFSGATDGVKQQDGKGEWLGGSPNDWWGEIHYPKLELKWNTPRKINKVLIYDRPSLEEHMAACVLKFSDGSEVHVFAVPNDGAPKTVVFEPRTVTSMKLDVLDGIGTQIGLSEIEVFYDPEAKPDVRRTKKRTDFVSYVDPTIETGRGRWFFCTPGSRPFGMISASAYTRNKNQGGGGYNYNSMEILGFANIHCWITSGINIMPVTGEVNPNLGETGWKSEFSHDSEIIEPGYHKVFLNRYKTQVEYTSTDRVALYRLKYAEAASAKLLVQLGGFVGSASYVDGKAELVSPTRVEGSHGMTDRLWGGPKLSHVFFVMEFDRPITRMDGWKGAEEKLSDIQTFHNPLPAGRVQKGYYEAVRKYLFKNLPEEQAGVSLAYDVKKGEEVLFKIGISYTSLENARKNLAGECPHGDFNRVQADARREWNAWLGKINVTGGAENTRVKFYTDLWHVLLGRHKINDLSGDYPSYMGRPEAEGVIPLVVKSIPKAKDGRPAFHMYNSDALWLTMWNLNILWGLGWPEMLDQFSASWMEYARNGGKLPRGPCAGGYTGIMTGCPATSLMTCAYQKGLMRRVDPEAAFAQMKRDHLPGGMMDASPFYDQNGWQPGSVGAPVQWAFEDWALAQMAKDLGKEEDYAHFMMRASGWTNYFSPKHGLLMPKDKDGLWLSDDPLSGKGWVEANAWQGSFSVSHDLLRLAELMGGRDKLADKLHFAFEQSAPTDFVYGYGGGYVSYANQPGCSNAHVFNHAGRPWLSQYWVRRVSRQAYGGINPNIGYGGHDEDQGQMGGVSALMKLGLFSLCGTSSREPIYEITAPEFDAITITLDPHYYSGKTFTIKTHDNSEKNCYIQRAELNGKPLENCWFYHRDFAKGGLLELWLGPEPNKSATFFPPR